MDIKIAHPKEALEYNKRFIDQITSAKVNQTQGTLGTPFIWGATNSWGGVRCRNFQYNQCSTLMRLSRKSIDEVAQKRWDLTIWPVASAARSTAGPSTRFHGTLWPEDTTRVRSTHPRALSAERPDMPRAGNPAGGESPGGSVGGGQPGNRKPHLLGHGAL